MAALARRVTPCQRRPSVLVKAGKQEVPERGQHRDLRRGAATRRPGSNQQRRARERLAARTRSRGAYEAAHHLARAATGAAGACLAPGHPPAGRLCLSLVGTALIVGSANALNMWWERDVDALMRRTRNRPLPAGRMSPDVAIIFGLALALIAAPMLFLVNAMTGVLGLVALVTYVLVYTPLKRHTHLALLVGAVPGAMPPLLGWTTATGSIGLGGLLLFGVCFLWQLPHFAAITIFRAEDYARAGLQVVSVQLGERRRGGQSRSGRGLLSSCRSFRPVRLAGALPRLGHRARGRVPRPGLSRGALRRHARHAPVGPVGLRRIRSPTCPSSSSRSSPTWN